MHKQAKLTRIVLAVILIAICLCIAGTIWYGRHAYNTAKAEGYETGYHIGMQNAANDTNADSRTLAGAYAGQYAYGGNRWKGYISGFVDGYDTALEHSEG